MPESRVAVSPQGASRYAQRASNRDPSEKPSAATLIASLTLIDASMLVIGCIVGSGIFRAASSIAAHVSSASLTLALWIFGGLLSLCGALCYAELAALFPKSGGDYIYISQIYGRFWGFLFGWTKLFIERTGTIAILASVFSDYLRRVLAYDEAWSRVIAAGAIILLTSVNVLGVRWGKYVQNTMTVLKIMALGTILMVGLQVAFSGNAVAQDWTAPALTASVWKSLGIGLVFVLWTYSGWTEAAYVADEVHEPTRNIPRAILIGLGLTTLLYVLVNWSYLLVIPMEQIQGTRQVAATVMQQKLGSAGGLFIAAMVACSAFGALNGFILTGARILYAMGHDHPLFARLGTVSPRFRTPALALWMNAGLAILLVCTKTFDQIATYSTLVISIFFTLAVFGVMRLRKEQPQAVRAYRAWGYPATPIIFCLTMIGFMANICITQPREAIFGFLLLALGLPLYAWSQRLRSSVR